MNLQGNRYNIIFLIITSLDYKKYPLNQTMVVGLWEEKISQVSVYGGRTSK